MLNSLCGFRLNTAGVVIGWIGAALSLLSIIVFGLCLGNVDALTKMIVDHMNDKSISEDSIRRGVIIIATVYLTINLINMIASALLIVGTVKERHLLLVPWLMNSGISWVFNAIYLVYLLVTSGSFGVAAIPLISAGISLAFQIIIWYAIYSLFKQIQAGRDQQQQLLRATAGSSYPSYTKI